MYNIRVKLIIFNDHFTSLSKVKVIILLNLHIDKDLKEKFKVERDKMLNKSTP